MKKNLLYFVAMIFLAACSDNDNNVDDENNIGDKEPISAATLIVGEWVYDNPSEGIWEKQEFRSNGKLTYSALTLNPYVRVDNAEGNYYYTTGDYKLTLNYSNIMGGTTYQDVVIKSIEQYSYTGTFYNDDNSYVGEYTYNKLVGECKINVGERFSPNYADMIKDANITSYTTNNTDIANVDMNTGEIIAQKAGVTYIKAHTDKGDAVVEVVVVDPDNLIPDFSSALNMNETTVKRTFTEFCTYSPSLYNRVCYPIRGNDYTDMVIIWIDDDKNVESVQVEVKTTSIPNDEQREKDIHAFLSSKYSYQEKNTNGIYIYFDFSQPNILPMAIFYSPSQNLIEYKKIEDTTNNLLPEYTQDLGKSSSELLSYYGEPFYETSNSLYFMQDNDFIEFVAFSLNSSDKVYAISALLKSNCDWQEVLTYMNDKFYYYEKGSDASNNFFAFTNNSSLEASNIGITFDGINGLITYVDLSSSNQSKVSILKETRNFIPITTKARPDGIISQNRSLSVIQR